MSEEDETPSDDKPKRGRPPNPKVVKGVILTDGVWSSQGEHRFKDKVELSAEDADILEAGGHFTRFD